MRIGVFAAIALGLSLFSPNVIAKTKSDLQFEIVRLNDKAIDAYTNLQIDRAVMLLKKAEAIGLKHHISGNYLGQTYANIGIIEAAGRQNNATAVLFFKKAICFHRTILLDPLIATPEALTLFKMARSQAQAPKGCDDVILPEQRDAATTPAKTDFSSASIINHQPLTEQTRLVPIPIYVEVHPSIQVGLAVLYYRTPGERIFQQVPMGPYREGYAAIIGCDVLQVLDPSRIEYYIAIRDTANQLRGTMGSEANPYQLSIIGNILADPVALPGSSPPPRCEEDCPPWNPDCNQKCKRAGEKCESTKDCCQGSSCWRNTCVGNGRESTEQTTSDKPIFRLDFSIGTGVGIVEQGKTHPYNQTAKTPDHIIAANPEARTGKIMYKTALAWAPFNLRLKGLFYLNRQFLLGAAFRGAIPFGDTGDLLAMGPAALAVIEFRLAGKNSSRGFELDGHVGLGGGITYHMYKYSDCERFKFKYDEYISNPGRQPWFNPDAVDTEADQYGCQSDDLDDDNSWDPSKNPVEKYFYLKSGSFVAEVGLDMYFWIAENFGIKLGLIAGAYISSQYAINLDFQLGPSIRF
jgi:hypothetical protein